MIKVITYGTYDLLHYGHLRLLERAKALGDYLIVGVTGDDYDRTRGKINNQQSLVERVQAVRDTGLADEILVEEYEGQKIDDIRRLGVDIFTVGSDWEGQFDYLNEYCRVVYLPRTEGISSSEVRTTRRRLKLGLLGDTTFRTKFMREAGFVNGVEIIGWHADQPLKAEENAVFYSDRDALLDACDAVYILSNPKRHEHDIRDALLRGKHVLVESPIAFSGEACDSLFALAKEKGCVLMEGIKTAYSTAYERLVLMAKSGKIGQVVSVDAVCTSLRDGAELTGGWNGMCAWSPTAMLPVFQILGTNYAQKRITTRFADRAADADAFTKIDFTYPDAVASIRVATAAKAEGELVVAGTKGYIYVPAPWWKTDYFEIRREDPADNRRCFYQLDGEGIRYEIVAFAKAVENQLAPASVTPAVSRTIAAVVGDFHSRRDMIVIG